MVSDQVVPDAPVFSDELVRQCKESGDYRPILFEWYKFVGQLSAVVGHIQQESPAFRSIPPQQFHVLIGLLNRCTRLILSNVALSHEGRFGETTAIVDRSITESALKVAWLCTDPSPEKFTRFFADGLKTDLELKAEIQANIAQRGGDVLPIETRMLKSIARSVATSGLTEQDVIATKKLPDFASMLTALGFNRLHYVVAQRIQSHHVHGTWTSLLTHYLEERDDTEETRFAPRGHDCDTHMNQYMFVAMLVLEALTAYVHYVFDASDAVTFEGLFAATKDEVMKVYREAVEAEDKRLA
jgi:hypothetical protein